MEQKKALPPRRVEDENLMWKEFGQLALKYKCVKLHVGMPAIDPPQFLLKEMERAAKEGHNQYSPLRGHPLLIEAIRTYYGGVLKQDLQPQNILVTIGATEGLFSAIMSIVQKGNEVVSFEPAYTCYQTQTLFAKGVYKTVPLELIDGKWSYDEAKLRATLGPKTKVFVLNTPHNPSGKIFSEEQLLALSKILKDYPHVLVLVDAVYSHLGQQVQFAALDENWNRTLTCFSFGKIFNATGWKQGVALGPAHIITKMLMMKCAYNFMNGSLTQVAFARALPLSLQPYKSAPSFTQYISSLFKESQTKLISLFNDSLFVKKFGMKLYPGDMPYFVIADVESVKPFVPARFFTNQYQECKDEERVPHIEFEGQVPLDYAVARWIALQFKIQIQPMSMFCVKGSPNRSEHFVRFAVCRSPESLEELDTLLKSL